ncbi:hypothetical protein BC830DRAFT_1172186 [Chytriomyces sp. MP71]|nr:hypothetical protein BC830DRAFT_1172186 [Chytriomyces sp. MP71]
MVQIDELTEEEQRRLINETGVLDRLREREERDKAFPRRPKATPKPNEERLFDSDEDDSGEDEDEDGSDAPDADSDAKRRKPLVDLNESDGSDDEDDVVFTSLLLAIPLSLLHAALEFVFGLPVGHRGGSLTLSPQTRYVVHAQYALEKTFNAQYMLTNTLPFFVALFILIVSTSRYKAHPLMQVAFAIAGAVSGVYIIKLSAPGAHQTFGDMLKTAPIAVVWIYSVIQCRLGYILCSTGVPLVYYVYLQRLDSRKMGGAFGL